MTKVKITFYLSEDTEAKLRKIAYLNRKSQSDLIVEGLELLFKTSPHDTQLKETI